MSKKLSKKPSKKPPPAALPKTFRGAEVVRGLGMNYEKFDRLIERDSLDQFDAMRDTWLVVPNDILDDGGFSEPRCFQDKEDAVRCAQAMANGNIDHRVLRVTEHVLVVATDNEL
jgi:hypothetical protein